MKFQAIKGVRDILPPESALWNRVEQTAREVFATYGYGEIRLPIFEQTELFARSVGVDTDIVSKEMFSFRDPFDDRLRHEILVEEARKRGIAVDSAAGVILSVGFEQLTLRPEATASVCRAYIEHGMHTLPGNVKLYYIGPMFRRERPQKGRYRQFYQIGAEVLGQSDAPAIDAEVIEMLMAFFERVELGTAGGTKLYINSIGCKECRPKYVAALKAALEKVRDKLGADSQRRIETNPLRVLDSKLPEEQAIIEALPRISDHLCEACRAHYAEVKQQLALRGVAYEENWRLVRGLDYYMRTTFEITAPGLGSQNAVCGGGRYDGLVELLGGPATKGIGFAIGTDRLILSLQSKGIGPSNEIDILVAWKDDASFLSAQRIARILRDAGLRVEMPSKSMQPREGLGYANKQAIPVAVIIGPDEVSAGVFALRLLGDREQVQVDNKNATQIGRLLLFRILLERALQQVAKKSGLDKQIMPLRQLLSVLVNKGFLPGHLKMPTEMAFDVFNRAVHGEELRQEEQSQAVAAAVLVLEELTRDLGLEADLRGH